MAYMYNILTSFIHTKSNSQRRLSNNDKISSWFYENIQAYNMIEYVAPEYYIE